MTAVAWLAMLAFVDPAPPPPAVLPESGGLAKGVSIDLLELGAIHAIGPGGTSSGIRLAIGAQFDRGPRWAWRLPVVIGVAPGKDSGHSFAEIALAPGVVYRWRRSVDQHWVPYLGGALQLGGFLFGRDLLGLPASPAGAKLTEFGRFGAVPELMAGAAWHPLKAFAIRPTVTYSYFRVAGANLHVITETICFRFAI